MKILFWQWNAFMQRGMENALERLQIEYDVFFYQMSDWENDDKFCELLRKKLRSGDYDRVLSVNYNPLISDVCQKLWNEGNHITYAAWVYDAPIHIRDISSFSNECNRIYFFDNGQVDAYLKLGYKNVFHMPLAADVTVWQGTVLNEEKYSCDVALVGKMYNSDYGYLCGPLSPYYRGRLEGILAAQKEVSGGYLLDELITDGLMSELNAFYRKASGGKKEVLKEELEFACACEVTGRERRMALTLLAGRYKTVLYSGDKNVGIEKLNYGGYVDYYTQMPQAFRGAKINLNISLRAIRTGIPLRVLDVLSCGGFLITNLQQELLEYFEPGEDLVIYEDIKDLVYKVDYYLKHEEERAKIARNGFAKVQKIFGFDERVRELVD